MRPAFQPTPDPTFSLMGIDVALLADEHDTAGAWEAIHQSVSPGAGSPLHTISGDKLFVVLDGELVLIIGDDEHVAGPGGTGFVPTGVAHRFENRSDREARLLVVTSGAGHVRFLAGMADLGARGPADRDAVTAHAAAHGVALLV